VIDVVVFGLSVLLSLLAGPRDRQPWTPTFPGTREERFVRAMHHYQERMGLEEHLVFHVAPSHPSFDAWVAPGGWGEVVVGYALDSGQPRRVRDGERRRLRVWKPELLALHEACHVRLAHHLGEGGEFKHVEVKRCMAAYSAKERR
jgi:hypothetical protein